MKTKHLTLVRPDTDLSLKAMLAEFTTVTTVTRILANDRKVAGPTETYSVRYEIVGEEGILVTIGNFFLEGGPCGNLHTEEGLIPCVRVSVAKEGGYEQYEKQSMKTCTTMDEIKKLVAEYLKPQRYEFWTVLMHDDFPATENINAALTRLIEAM